MTRWIVGFLWCGTVASTAVVAWASGYAVGTRRFESIPRPTRQVVLAGNPARDRELADLRELVVELRREADTWERAVLQGDAARQKSADREEALFSVAEAAMSGVATGLDHPMWLRAAYRIHERKGQWIVEGVVLESHADGGFPGACFWAVEIPRAGDLPGEPRRAMWGLHAYEKLPSGRWQDAGAVKVPDGTPYPKLDYDSPNWAMH